MLRSNQTDPAREDADASEAEGAPVDPSATPAAREPNAAPDPGDPNPPAPPPTRPAKASDAGFGSFG